MSRGQFHHCLMLSDSNPDVKLGFAKAPGRFSIIFRAADWDMRKASAPACRSRPGAKRASCRPSPPSTASP
jgi:hypothetical protein